MRADLGGPCAERRIRRLSLKAGGFGREVLLRTDSSGRAEAELSEGRDEGIDTHREQAGAQQLDHLHYRDFATRLHEASKQPIGQQLPKDVSHLHYNVVVLDRKSVV